MKYSEEENNAIEEVKNMIEEVTDNTKQETPTYIFARDIKCLSIILNLINKLQKQIENHMKENKFAKEHINAIHFGYENYLKTNFKVQVSPLDILERIERKPGKSHIRRIIIKENEIDRMIINFEIPEKYLNLYK